jgi:hypothetical protein
VKDETSNERYLRRFMIWGTALPAGVAAASLQALGRDFSFHITATTVLVFILGTTVMGLFGRVIFNPSAKGRAKLFLPISIVLVLLGVGAFLYPLRYASPGELPELLTGLAAAVFALAVVATLVLILRRLFEGERPNADEEKREP